MRDSSKLSTRRNLIRVCCVSSKRTNMRFTLHMNAFPQLRRILSRFGGISSGYAHIPYTLVSTNCMAQDDLWRRNHATIKGLALHESDFNPHYPTSIAYVPLPRLVLERFLAQRGLLSAKAGYFDPFHSGFLNKVYLRLNEVAFHGSSKVSDHAVCKSIIILLIYYPSCRTSVFMLVKGKPKLIWTR